MRKSALILIFLLLVGVNFCFADEYSLSEQAVIYYNDNNLVKSFEVLSSIEEDKRTAQDWFLLGNILQDEEKVSEAVFMYKRAILVDKAFYKPYYNLANIYLENDQTYMAIDNYKSVLKLKPDFSYVYYNLGCAYLRLGDLGKAKRNLLKAIELNKTEPNFYYNLAYVYKKMKKEKVAREYLAIYNEISKGR